MLKIINDPILERSATLIYQFYTVSVYVWICLTYPHHPRGPEG
ncbi:hypothetical protein PIIN_11448 [Serendipita indica DSM 11827]|uniref:Uncharacterized protein n=1 Tax=Serendipita indica (strain DSM 11827) TaxID=1109443 RepID=G4U1M8_SERID|nr:hypothetical protein PIIN_11448 [Serendipita indica DSM 11827]